MTGHVARMGAMRNVYNILVGNLKGINRLEDLGMVRKIILE